MPLFDLGRARIQTLIVQAMMANLFTIHRVHRSSKAVLAKTFRGGLVSFGEIEGLVSP